jgi:hypothetical protein
MTRNHIGFCFTEGRLRKMRRSGRNYTCVHCNTKQTIYDDRVEIIVSKEGGK